MGRATILLLGLGLAACGLFAWERSGAQPPSERELGQPTAAASPPAEAIDAESARLDEWFGARFEEQLGFSPIEKTRLGRKEGYDEIDDFSESAVDAQLEWRRGTVEELRHSFDYDLLTSEAKTSYDVWIYQYEEAEAARPFQRRSFIFEQMNGAQSGLPQFLINFHTVASPEEMRAYVSRIGGIARALTQLTERAQLAAEEGVRPSRFAYEGVLEQARAVITGAPFEGEGDSPLWSDAREKIDALIDAGVIDDARADSFRADVRSALVERLVPAYRSLIEWVEAELPYADETATGVWKLPDGAAYYEQRLASSTTTQLGADDIHEIGLAEVARIRAEMEQIKSAVGFDGTLDEFFAFVRDDDQFYFPDTDEGREAYLDEAREHLARIGQRLPEFFGVLPKADLVVRRVEPFREQPGGAQHYYPGAPDGSRPGVFYAHLADMRAMPRPQLEVIAYHEGVPGHHMQISIMQELTSVPAFRTQTFFNAYVEGWALYAELLAKEMGAYEDPYADFGRLTTEIWRAIRLVLDTGLHAMQWTEEDAVEYFIANSPAAEGQIRSEVRRYIVWPGQATGYKIGMLEIMRLREEAERELGEAFDLRDFHDMVLGGGALPLSILEHRIDEWKEARRQR
jgi:uncharacterized protein (DUF885 family)